MLSPKGAHVEGWKKGADVCVRERKCVIDGKSNEEKVVSHRPTDRQSGRQGYMLASGHTGR